MEVWAILKEKNTYHIHSIYSLLKWITRGAVDNFNTDHREEINHKACMNLAEIIMNEVKSKRQLNYSPTNPDAGFRQHNKNSPSLIATGLKCTHIREANTW